MSITERWHQFGKKLISMQNNNYVMLFEHLVLDLTLHSYTFNDFNYWLNDWN